MAGNGLQRCSWKLPLLLLLLPGASSQLDEDDLPFRPGKPVVINLGPLMDSDIGAALRDMFVQPQRMIESHPMIAGPSMQFEQPDLFRGLLKDFGEHLVPAMQSGSGGFQTSVTEGHFRLRATLPGYSMHRSSDGDEPLMVKVIGRTLLVQGTKTTGQMTTSFQRSFPLPFVPDASKVSVNYSAQDGSLLVDVPPGPGQTVNTASTEVASPEISEEMVEPSPTDLFDILGGPQMTLAFADADRRAGKELRARPRLRGLPILMGGFRSPPHRPMQMDPFASLWEELSDMTEPTFQAEAEGMETSSTSPAPPMARPAEQGSVAAPVVVQPAKAAKPFWRLPSTADMSRNEYLDIVSPQGVELGKIGGSYVEFFSKDDSSHGAKKLQLPVPVHQEDCAQTQMGSQEQVVRCNIQPQSVKSVHINVIDEL